MHKARYEKGKDRSSIAAPQSRYPIWVIRCIKSRLVYAYIPAMGQLLEQHHKSE
jgi:hypothetical protein